MTSETSFPRQQARTQRFTLGVPRSFTISPDGRRVVFLRSASGADRVTRLWVLDLETGAISERVAADPVVLLGGAPEKLSAEERARRERTREGAAGIVGYATDRAVEIAAFPLSGRLFTAELRAGTAHELNVPGPVVDPRPSPDGRLIAYTARGALRVTAADGSADTALAEPDHEDDSWGLAEFIAAEEMGRARGYWWSPESDRLLAAHVDNAPISRWWIADPSDPATAPAQVRYPAAGTANADVTLALVDLDGSRVEVVWDRAMYPYLASAHWSAGNPPILLVQARDQRDQLVLSVDTDTGGTLPLRTERDPVWLELVPGVPCWTPDGRLARVCDEDGARVLRVGESALTGPSLHIRAVLDVGEEDVLVSASAGSQASEPEVGEVHIHRVGNGGVERVSDTPGVHSAARSGSVTVLSSTSLDRCGPLVRVLRDGKQIAEIASYPEDPVIRARPDLLRVPHNGSRRGRSWHIPCAVLLPTGHSRSDGSLPVLMDPYGGPHGQRVLAAHNPYLTSQWFADQGFAVVVADGRGTPGHSPEWEKAVRYDLAESVLDDQIAALHTLADRYPFDLSRVAIRGWSFGGYLAALAVLRHPEVFHAAVAGAPVTDFRLYDTHYTERYLGSPAERPEVYAGCSLVTDEGLGDAREPVRPLLLIHGLADDNVVAAHTLRLSSALLAAGRPHQVLPLSGVTHMTPQERVAENLLLLQLDFLKRSLGFGGE